MREMKWMVLVNTKYLMVVVTLRVLPGLKFAMVPAKLSSEVPRCLVCLHTQQANFPARQRQRLST
jgi:hypothetical protein